MEDLFDQVELCFAVCLRRLHDIDVDSRKYPLFMFSMITRSRLAATPLYYAALCGFHDLAENLIVNHPEYVNANGGHYVSPPLAAALGGGHFKIAQLLYERGTVVDVQGHNNGLFCMVLRTVDILKLLNEYSVEVQIQMFGMKKTAGLNYMMLTRVDTSRLPVYYSGTKRQPCAK
jgi:hypothetical protein